VKILEPSIQKDLKQIAKTFCRVKEVIAVILYGSYARGDAGPRSDIDIYVVCDTEKNMRKVEKKITDILHGKTERVVQPLCVSLQDMGDPGIASKIFREGRAVFIRHPFFNFAAGNIILDTKPYRLISLPISQLSQKDKVRFNTAIYGKKVKNYEYKGLLHQTFGVRFGKGVILVPEENADRILRFCESYDVKPKQVKIWVEETIEQ
jgi:predicted nucleotidyltransferase